MLYSIGYLASPNISSCTSFSKTLFVDISLGYRQSLSADWKRWGKCLIMVVDNDLALPVLCAGFWLERLYGL